MSYLCIMFPLENSSLSRQSFASLTESENFTFTFLPGFNDSIIFPSKIIIKSNSQGISLISSTSFIADGIPLDGTILNITHTYEIGLVIVFDILASLGIFFDIGCLIFNIIFRNRKYSLYPKFECRAIMCCSVSTE